MAGLALPKSVERREQRTPLKPCVEPSGCPSSRKPLGAATSFLPQSRRIPPCYVVSPPQNQGLFPAILPGMAQGFPFNPTVGCRRALLAPTMEGMTRPILPIYLILAMIAPAAAQVPAPAPGPNDRLTSFADTAELALAAPVILRATITRASRLTGKAAPDVAAGRARLLVTASVSNVLVSPGPMGGTLRYLWDAPLDSRGRTPVVKGLDILTFLDMPKLDGGTRLISRRAQQPWDSALADTVRAVVAEQRSGDVPIIRGVSNGFRADGTIPGESESQFFLATADDKPATLVVQNRPGEVRRVLVARGDIIDEAAERVRPGTLLWYRLACFLPVRLPAAAGGGDPALAKDWSDALASIGPCEKTN